MIKTEELKQKIEKQRKVLEQKIESHTEKQEIYKESILLDQLIEKYSEIVNPTHDVVC